jgi:hypothetical protein
MKNLSTIWFIKEPIDPEHKEYVLLDYLKSISKNINSKNCYPILRAVSKIIKSLNEFKKNNKIGETIISQLTDSEKSYLKNFNFANLDREKKESILMIIESSLETLYEYSEIFLDMLKNEESKIKIFKVQSKFNLEKEDPVNSGILIIRNMVNDKIIPYYWQGGVTLKTENGNKKICVLKKIILKNSRYSMNYEFIYHEILDAFSIEKNVSPELYVIEIYEDFDENSDIYKLAKERFIETIT